MLFTEFNLEDAKEVWAEEAERRGERRGEQQGEKKARITIAKSLLDILDLETIAEKTGLSMEELNKLKAEMMV